MAKAEVEEQNPDRFEKLVDKDPSDLHERFAEWLVEKTGYEDVDVKSVQLACALRIEFQKSPENQEVLAAKRDAAEKAEAEREEKREAREQRKREEQEAKAKKAAAAKAKPAEDEEDEAEKPKPAARRRRGSTTAKAKAEPVAEEADEDEAEEPAAKPDRWAPRDRPQRAPGAAGTADRAGASEARPVPGSPAALRVSADREGRGAVAGRLHQRLAQHRARAAHGPASRDRCRRPSVAGPTSRPAASPGTPSLSRRR